MMRYDTICSKFSAPFGHSICTLSEFNGFSRLTGIKLSSTTGRTPAKRMKHPSKTLSLELEREKCFLILWIICAIIQQKYYFEP